MYYVSVSSTDSLPTSIYSMTLPACNNIYDSNNGKNEVQSYFDEFMKSTDITALDEQKQPADEKVRNPLK